MNSCNLIKFPIKICIVTGSRSEYGLMRWLMDAFKTSDDYCLQVVVTGSHFSKKHGSTYREIEADGFKIDARLPMSLDNDDALSLSKATGLLTSEFSQTLELLKPDVVMVMGDRYELLSVLTCCILSGIPVAHISGGEITEGALDEQIRHAMTKISHFHYVANEVYASRIYQMGEEKWRVCISGEPGLENLHRQPIISAEKLMSELGLNDASPIALITYHTVTLQIDELDDQMNELLSALEQVSIKFAMQFVITYPNADLGFDLILQKWEEFVSENKSRVLVSSLGQTRYLSALRSFSLMIGNSSSGLVEAPSFNMPAVNIGIRQKGRIRGDNVIDVQCTENEIVYGIEQALRRNKENPCVNPYGDGHSSSKILEHLKLNFSKYSKKQILRKKFCDTPKVVEIEKKFIQHYSKC